MVNFMDAPIIQNVNLPKIWSKYARKRKKEDI